MTLRARIALTALAGPLVVVLVSVAAIGLRAAFTSKQDVSVAVQGSAGGYGQATDSGSARSEAQRTPGWGKRAGNHRPATPAPLHCLAVATLEHAKEHVTHIQETQRPRRKPRAEEGAPRG